MNVFEKRFCVKLYDATHSFCTVDTRKKPKKKETWTRVELKETMNEEQQYEAYSLHNKEVLVREDFAPENILVYVTNVTFYNGGSADKDRRVLNSEGCYRLIDVLNPKVNVLENLPVPASFKEKGSVFDNNYIKFLHHYRGYIEAYMDYFSIASYHVADGKFNPYNNSFRGEKEVYNFKTLYNAQEKIDELIPTIDEQEKGKYYIEEFDDEFVNREENEILYMYSEHGYYRDFPRRRIVLYRSLEAEKPVENYGKSVAKKSDKPSEKIMQDIMNDNLLEGFNMEDLF